MKTAFISTVYNEEGSIREFLKSLFIQTKLPDEIVIVDASSTDTTFEIIQKEIADFKKFHKHTNVIALQKKGNRSQGRNTAIAHTDAEIIAASDAGCTLNKNWFEQITAPFRDESVEVVAGYYHPVAHSVFQKCLAAYTSVMPDSVDPNTFLPSSRSIAFRKSAWEKVGKYPENLDTCEDLVFAKQLEKKGCKRVFIKDAVVYWPQKKTLTEAFWQFFHYAKGDGQAKYFRKNTWFLFGRYLFLLVLIDIYVTTHATSFLWIFVLLFFLYCIWAVQKNYRYVKNWRAIYWLPILQFTADFSVISGMTVGVFHHD